MRPLLTLLRFGRLLSLVLWIGGLCFFAFVVAPVAFGRLASAHEAGLVVGGTLRVLHVIGLCCGAVFVAVTAVAYRGAGSRRGVAAEVALAGAMMLLTAYSQFHILPAMESARAGAGGDVEAVAATDTSRVEFERLHRVSERVEGGVLLCGLALLLVVASEAAAGEGLPFRAAGSR